jgi:hypothetical protein
MRSCSYLVSAFCAFSTLGCWTAGPNHIRISIPLRYPNFDLYGDYAYQWTLDDVRQVLQLVAARSDIQHPIYQVEAQKPDQARVISGHAQNNGDLQTEFLIRKRQGHWTIIETSINTSPVIIISWLYDTKGLTSRCS